MHGLRRRDGAAAAGATVCCSCFTPQRPQTQRDTPTATLYPSKPRTCVCCWCSCHKHAPAHGVCVHTHCKACEGLEAPVAAVVEHIVLLLAWRDVEVAGIRHHASTVGHRGVLDTVVWECVRGVVVMRQGRTNADCQHLCICSYRGRHSTCIRCCCYGGSLLAPLPVASPPPSLLPLVSLPAASYTTQTHPHAPT